MEHLANTLLSTDGPRPLSPHNLRAKFLYRLSEDPNPYGGTNPAHFHSYVEAQIHGGIDPKTDVASVNASANSGASRDSLIDFGKRFGVPVYSHELVYDEQGGNPTTQTTTLYDPNEKPATPEMEQPVGGEKKVAGQSE